ncbi:EAL domain-containing protein [Pacificoceanicola onchidii]|uniref:EAL domain-containing protein n=1 Tax=Pacificoceanicola onchidii TaxID=2562685 RepID=UPI001456008A|nr:EAL domain-containing protein [Pacificoceanicola onchidii]
MRNTPLFNAISITPEVVERVFPFYVLLCPDGTVQHVGPSLAKVSNQDALIGQPVNEALKVLKPFRLDPDKRLSDAIGQRLVVEAPARQGTLPLKLYGMVVKVTHAGVEQLLLALTPGVNARRFVEIHGLKTSDFSPSDGSADILPLLAMQEDMLTDSKRQSEKLRAARDAAEHLANHDVLTERPNRRALMKHLTIALSRTPLTVLHIDLDKFKEINDTFGHAAGDVALQHSAKAIQSVIGPEAMCARLGGDEFVGVLLGEWPEKELQTLARDVIKQISEPFAFMDETLTIGASIGLARARPDDQLTPDDILHRADLALYEVKRTGRNTALLCTPELFSEHIAFQRLSADIRRALLAQEFVAHLQPQVDVTTGRLIGFEALARWEHPERGVVFPGQFLGVTDRAGLIQHLDSEIRRSALNTLKCWDKKGIHVPKVSLNVTTRDLLDPHFRDVLLWDLDRRELDPSRVMLEIVESVLYDDNSEQIAFACETLVQAGFSLALDDFGTGYASILSLVNLPISLVKIDRAFAAGVASDPRKSALAQSMVGMARTLGLEVLAEGVDDESDVAALTAMGCTLFQSFHFGRPMAPDAALTWIGSHTPAPPKPDARGTARAP